MGMRLPRVYSTLTRVEEVPSLGHLDMKVRLRLFASLREAVGRPELDLDLPEGATAETAWTRLTGMEPGLKSRRGSLAASVNRRYASFETPLRDGDEIVFIPPVSGG